MAQRVIYAAIQWVWIVAILGNGRKMLDRDGPARCYSSDAIFPFYIVHQTVIIAAVVWLRPAQLAAGVEAMVLLAITAVASVPTYEIVRRVCCLRPLFGLRRSRGTRRACPERPAAAGSSGIRAPRLERHHRSAERYSCRDPRRSR